MGFTRGAHESALSGPLVGSTAAKRLANCSSRRDVAQSQVDSAAAALQLTLQRVITPLEQAEIWIRLNPNYTHINATWRRTVAEWWRSAVSAP